MEKGNFIKIDRSILEWEWYRDINTKCLFFHCLLKANWKDTRWKGYEVKRGSFITSVGELSIETGLTINQVRTALLHLKKTGEITIKTTNKFTIITIEKYSVFQEVRESESQSRPQTNHKQITNKTQTSHNQTTTIEEYKEYKELKEEKEELKKESEERKTAPPFFDSVWKDIITLYPRRKGLENECKIKYYEMLESHNNQSEFIEETQAVIIDFVERYDREHPDDVKREYIYSFKRFFNEKFTEELQNYRKQKAIFKGWRENDKIISVDELRKESVNSEYEHKGEAEYTEVLRELYRAYPIHNFFIDAYESLFFGIVNRYKDGTGANLLYAAVGKYLDDMKRRKQYSIPDFGYWLKYEAVKVMETVTECERLIS